MDTDPVSGDSDDGKKVAVIVGDNAAAIAAAMLSLEGSCFVLEREADPMPDMPLDVFEAIPRLTEAGPGKRSTLSGRSVPAPKHESEPHRADYPSRQTYRQAMREWSRLSALSTQEGAE